MKFVNATPLKAAPFAGRMNFPRHSLTWIVKGTFDLRPGGVVAFADQQDFPTADEFYPDDAEGAAGPRYESDFAWFKPRADILVVGDCHAPEGKPVTHCRAAVRVGAREKAVAVVGNRRWERRWLAWEATPPESFARMALRYENSFGGPKFAANPVGKGSRASEGEDGDRHWPLPNLEDPAQLVTGTGSRPPAAGFGPMSRRWSGRHSKIGTYKGAYRKTRWPWFPEDFDWGFMNAAPPDLQVEGYLRGDEPVVIENLHPRHARYEFRLPGLRVRSFVHRAAPPGPGAPSFEEIDLKLDTLWIDMEEEKLVLLWRGWVPTTSEEFEDILDCYVATEPLDQPPQPKDWHYRAFKGADAAVIKAFEPEAPPPPEPIEAPPAAEDPAEAAAREKTQALLTIVAGRANEHLGIDKLSGRWRQHVIDAQTKLAERLTAGPAKAAELGAAQRAQQLKAALTSAGIDPLQPLPAPAAALGPILAAMGFGPEFAKAEPAVVAAMGAIVGKLADTPDKLAALLGELAKAKEKLGIVDPEPAPVPTPPLPPPLTRDDVVARAKARESFEGESLAGLDLSGLDLSDLNLAGARLEGAALRQAKLAGTDLTGASLVRADLAGADLKGAHAAGADFSTAKLRGADLTGADLAGAKLFRADLAEANLTQAILEGADLQEAICNSVNAREALVARADLRESQFKDARCEKADFSKSRLDQANFRSAVLTEARWEQVAGAKVDLTGATLTKFRATGSRLPGALLARSKGPGSIWKGTDLSGADLRFAQLPDALFKGAVLKGANLSGAEMRHGNFCKADLSGAKMRQMNLFQGSLEKAKLSQTDLSGSNLYEVEFLDAILDRTVAEGANTKMTKLDLV